MLVVSGVVVVGGVEVVFLVVRCGVFVVVGWGGVVVVLKVLVVVVVVE